MNKPKIDAFQTRYMPLELGTVSTEARSVRAALSSETPVKRIFGDERLIHSAEAINLERAAGNGLPLLFNHDDDRLIGRVRNVSVDGDRLRGDLVFDEGEDEADKRWAQVERGTLTDVSIRYRIDDWRENEDASGVEVTRWTPVEASVVSVPADGTVGIGRKEDTMSDSTQDTAGVPDEPTLEQIIGPNEAVRSITARQGADQERARIATVRKDFAPHRSNEIVSALEDEVIERGISVVHARKLLLDALTATPLGERAEPLAKAPAPGQTAARAPVQAGEDASDKFATAATEAICLRSGLLQGEEAEQARKSNPLTTFTLSELVRESLKQRSGYNFAGRSLHDMVGDALMQSRFIEAGAAANTVATFPAILENVLNKSLFVGWDEAPRTWSVWCSTGSLPDYKAGTMPNLSHFEDLAIVAENGEYQEGARADKKAGR